MRLIIVLTALILVGCGSAALSVPCSANSDCAAGETCVHTCPGSVMTDACTACADCAAHCEPGPLEQGCVAGSPTGGKACVLLCGAAPVVCRFEAGVQ